VLTTLRKHAMDAQMRADVAAGVEAAIVDVLVGKSLAALEHTNCNHLVVAGGVGANSRLRAELSNAAGKIGGRVHYPPIELCTDNGAMIAFAGAMRLLHGAPSSTGAFTVRARWELSELAPAGSA
jgi:N6-L-threonylcarbamoyladenine synthase